MERDARWEGGQRMKGSVWRARRVFDHELMQIKLIL